MNQEEVGIIYPPSDIRSIVDLTAGKVAKNGVSLENKIREMKRGDIQFSFLNQGDAYHPYYRSMISKFLRAEINPGEETDEKVNSDSKQPSNLTNDSASTVQPPPLIEKEVPLPPPPYQFLSDLPPVSALDLDIIKLTALFVARNGPQFRADLVQKEGRNYQFDFLKPGHSLFPHYNRLVDQYYKVILPPKSIMENLSNTNKQQILKNVMKRVDYTLYEESLRKEAAEQEDKERMAFAAIDWHDFVVVQTLEFTETDQKLDLPGPTKKEDLVTMSFAEKRAVALGRPIDELPLEPIPPPPEPRPPTQNLMPVLPIPPPPPPMIDPPVKHPVGPLPTAPPSVSSVKIRRDYVPKLGAREETKMEICPVCSRKYASSEIAEHIRVCSLDPKSKEQKAIYENKNKTSNLLKENIDVRKNLTQFSSHRSDLFGVESSEYIFSKNGNEDEKNRQPEKDKGVIYDRVGALPSHQPPLPNSNIATEITPTYTTPVAKANHPIEEQLAAIQRKVEGQPGSNVVPLPAAPPVPQPPPPAQLPFNPPPPPLPSSSALPKPPAPPAFGFVPPPPPSNNIAPPREPPFTSNEGDAKKFKHEGNTSLVSEQQWTSMNQGPISIVISVANEPSKPEWKLQGQKLELTNLSSTSTIKQLKEQLHATLGIPSAKQKLSYQLGNAPPQITKNESTLAYYNFGPNANIQLGIKERGGKK